MVFIVSNKYITNSFDSWFDERVEKALESGINLGKDDLDTSLKTCSSWQAKFPMN